MAKAARKMRVRIQEKFSFPAICLVFGLIGASLGARPNFPNQPFGLWHQRPADLYVLPADVCFQFPWRERHSVAIPLGLESCIDRSWWRSISVEANQAADPCWDVLNLGC